MVLLRPVEDVEGIGGVYGERLRSGGIGTLDDLRCATVNEIERTAGSGAQRARAWKAQAWFMALGMPKDVAEVIVSAGICYTLQELALAGMDRIVHAIQLDQDDPGPSPKKIPKTARINVTRSMVRDWKRKAIFAWGFYPSAPFLPAGHPEGGYASILSYSNFSICSALEDAAEEALGDIPGITPEERLDIRNQLVEEYRSCLFSPPTDEDQENVRRVLANIQRLMADALLKHLDLWPAVPWLRDLALRTATDVIDFTLPQPDIFQRDLFQGISELQIKGLLVGQLARKIRTRGLYALFEVVDQIRHSLSDPGLRALGGRRKKGGLAGLDGTGVQLGLVGQGWDHTHPAFATAALTSDDAPEPNSPWIGLDTAVLSQIAAVPLPAQGMIARPALGPAGIAPSTHITLFAAESTAAALASAIDRASTALGAGAVLLVPRTCVGVVRGSGVHTLVDLPLPANPETHAALLRAVEAGLIVIVPAGIGGRDLSNLPIDGFLVDPVGTPPAGLFPVIGPTAEPGIADRLAEGASAGVLVVGTSSPWSNRGTGVIRVPDIPFTVAGGTERVIAGAGFTVGWHGPHAAAATAAGLATLSIQATALGGKVATVEPIRNLLQRYTAPAWATVPQSLAIRGRRHAAVTCTFGVATEDTLTSGKLATHALSATILLRRHAGLPLESFLTNKATSKAALIEMYNATDGPNWKNNTNWLSDRPMDEWYGVRTDGTGRVIDLVLYNNKLRGQIPSELGSLSNLTRLDLGNNQLSGPLPSELRQLTNLTNLRLSNNQLSGEIPVWIGSLSNLRWLSLGGNSWSDSIPSELGNLSNLESLELRRIQLSGPIPAWLANLTNLKYLYLYTNRLSGPIPAWLANLTNLRQLELSNNQLSGNIPPELGHLSNLQRLYLSNNGDLSGPLPGSFTALDALKILRLQGTQLCAPPNAAFQTWLQGIANKRGVVNCGPTGSASPRRLTNNGGQYPSWSPDGHRIAFLSPAPLYEASSLYVMDSDGSNQRQLTNNVFNDPYGGPFAWSPDGRHIAFLSGSGNRNYDIYVIDSDGSNQRQLTDNNVRDWYPSWSPDSRRITFVSRLQENGAAGDQIYVIDSDGSNQRQLTRHGSENRRAAWSPDGRHIAFDSWDIQVIDPDGSNLRNLTNSRGIWDGWPFWSPNSRHIAFIRQNPHNEIWVMNSDGSNPRNLTQQTRDTGYSWYGRLAWSPDSRQIAFNTDRDGNHEIYVMGLADSNPRRLTNNSASDESPSWSPDGNHIAFTSNRDGRNEIYVIDASK